MADADEQKRGPDQTASEEVNQSESTLEMWAGSHFLGWQGEERAIQAHDERQSERIVHHQQ